MTLESLKGKLTQKERLHLYDNGINNLEELKEVCKKQAEQRVRTATKIYEPCWECYKIADKLGWIKRGEK